jgi:putative flavoprotein involved in K+ transport
MSSEAGRWLSAFSTTLSSSNVPAATRVFHPTSFWRDLVAFTWNLKTCEGPEEIAAMLAVTLPHTKPSNFRLTSEPRTADGVTEAWFSFETAVGRGVGHVRLRDGKCWTLLTALRELKGFEEKAGVRREQGVEHGVHAGRRNWGERRAAEAAALGRSRQPYVLIVGGGQGGIGLAARLKRLGVPALVVEKNARAGDSWRKRYASLVLHDPVWYDHLPYLPFPDHWPVFTPKDKLGDWLEMYVAVMELDYWTSSRVTGARWDERAGEWEAKVEREGEGELTLRPKHLVLATGMSGVPNLPKVPGADAFAGTVVHSSAYKSGEAWRGKRAVVVGSSTSAHDICADLWEHGAQPTMLQRSNTVVAKSETLREVAWGRLYSEEALAAGITTDLADLTVASVPFKVLPTLQKSLYERVAKKDAGFYAALGKAGFRYDFGEDGSGLHSLYLRRGAGYYIEVGASQLIIDGAIALEHGSVARLSERSVVLDDGTVLPADLVVFATGYGGMEGWAAQLISPAVAERVGRVWGVGSGTKGDPGPWEGELRNMWKPTRQPGLWFHGGNLMQSRHYSLYLALQLKARLEGIATPVYGAA